jgi:ribosomal protein S18 acetylase RimI-like enzyme
MATLTFVELSEGNAREAQNLNAAVLPLPYDERFYRQILNQNQGRFCTYLRSPHSLSPTIPLTGVRRLAVAGKETVGAVMCTVHEKKKGLCIATLAVLAPYRRSGIGKALYVGHVVAGEGAF